jgi:phospholipase/carboxylesterase
VKNLDFIHHFAPAKDGSSRTLLLLHGTGGNENQLLDLGRAIDPSAALLSPRGRVLENGAPRFFRRLAEGVFDEADVVARAEELSRFVEQATAGYAIDARGLVAVGYSNGANIAAAMMLLGIAGFSSAILLRAMVPLSRLDLPAPTPGRVLLLAGESDPIARPATAKKLAMLLEKTGKEIELMIHPEVGHALVESDVLASRQWLGGSALDLTERHSSR